MLKETKMTQDKQEYIDKLNKLGRHLCSLILLDSEDNLFFKAKKDKNTFLEQVEKLELGFFFSNFIDEVNGENIITPDLIVRFTVDYKLNDIYNTNNTTTVAYTNEEVIKAILNKVYDPDYNISYSQMYSFEYSKPNSLQLYDSYLELGEMLGLEFENNNLDEEDEW